MKKNILYIALVLSIVTNIVILCIFLADSSSKNLGHIKDKEKDSSSLADYNKRQEAAEVAVGKLVCDNLYYPDSYDPVNTMVDSAFYNYITDPHCVDAAIQLIDLRKEYKSSKNKYEDSDRFIRFSGGYNSSTLERERKDRAEAAEEMNRLQKEIERQESIIKNRDNSDDGKFIGWQVVHKYRASNSNGIVSFGNVLYVLDPQMNQYLLCFSLDNDDKKNLQSIRKVIEEELGVIVE